MINVELNGKNILHLLAELLSSDYYMKAAACINIHRKRLQLEHAKQS